MEAPGGVVRSAPQHLGNIEGVVRSAPQHLGNIEAHRVAAEEDTGWSVAVEGGLGVAGELCSMVEVVGDGAEEDPVARGGDDALV